MHILNWNVLFQTLIRHTTWILVRIQCTRIKFPHKVHRKTILKLAHWSLRSRRCSFTEGFRFRNRLWVSLVKKIVFSTLIRLDIQECLKKINYQGHSFNRYVKLVFVEISNGMFVSNVELVNETSVSYRQGLVRSPEIRDPVETRQPLGRHCLLLQLLGPDLALVPCLKRRSWRSGKILFRTGRQDSPDRYWPGPRQSEWIR